MSGGPHGWVETTIGDVSLRVAKHRPDDSPDAEFTYIDISSIDNERHAIVGAKRIAGRDAPSRARQLVAAGDTVLSTVRTYLKNTAAVPSGLDGATASTGFCVLRPAPGIEPRFLLYRVLEGEFVRELSTRQTGTSYPAVRDADVRAMPILLPPTAEQGRIVGVVEEQFSRLDAGVESLQRAKRNLSRLRASVLQVAVAGRLVPQEPEDVPAAALLNQLREERRSAWERDQIERFEMKGRTPKSDSWKAKYKTPQPPDGSVPTSIPVHWLNVSLGTVALGLRYGTSTKCEYQATGDPVLRIPNVRAMSVDIADLKRAVDPGVDLKSVRVRRGDLLFIRTNGSPELIGRVGVVGKEAEGLAFASYLIRATLLPGLLPRFAALVLESPQFRRLLLSRAATTAGQYNISASTLARVPLPLPPEEEQKRIVAEVERRFSILDAMEQAIEGGLRRATRLRQAILREAFAGRLVPQDPSDEPAAALLERVGAERVTV